MNKLITERAKLIKEPEKLSSYSSNDCIFLLKNVNGLLKEKNIEEREKAMQNGTHYGEMLPIEQIPSEDYMRVFYSTLKDNSEKIAKLVSIVSEQIIKLRGTNVILVSLARAGTPIGVLIKRYIKFKYGIDCPHYSLSIIRGRGIDENALVYILNKHKSNNIQFIDGWTGKGTINNVLKSSCDDFKEKYDIELNPELAVLADPAQCVNIYATREDYLIPSACLNSTVTGLMSRTIINMDEYNFHGAKFYKEWESIDVSNYFIDEIVKYFKKDFIRNEIEYFDDDKPNTGILEVKKIQEQFGISDINKVKPGIGETTRVLLRRVPWKILVKDLNCKGLKHIYLLAEEKNIPIEEYKDMNYLCCGLIKTLTKNN